MTGTPFPDTVFDPCDENRRKALETILDRLVHVRNAITGPGTETPSRALYDMGDLGTARISMNAGHLRIRTEGGPTGRVDVRDQALGIRIDDLGDPEACHQAVDLLIACLRRFLPETADRHSIDAADRTFAAAVAWTSALGCLQNTTNPRRIHMTWPSPSRPEPSIGITDLPTGLPMEAAAGLLSRSALVAEAPRRVALRLGGGLDVKITPHFSLEPSIPHADAVAALRTLNDPRLPSAEETAALA